MDYSILDKMIREIGSKRSASADGASALCFGEQDTAPADFSKDNFHAISSEKAHPKSRIVFIDGGNAELFSSPSSCAHFIRVFHSVWEDGRRSSCSSDEFYVLASATGNEGKIAYSVRMFKSKASTLTDSFFSEEFIIDPLDKGMRQGNNRLELSNVPGIVRRLAEISSALLLAGGSGEGDLIVIDGNLSARSTDERKLISALKDIAGKKHVSVCGISKTTNALTSGVQSVVSVLDAHAPEGAWYYHPAADTRAGGIEMYFAKFHPSSGYIFKVDSFDDASSHFPSLESNSKDPVFLGYPYGLVEADRFARISNREKECLRTIFMARTGKDWNSLDSASRSLDAHSVLDNIS